MRLAILADTHMPKGRRRIPEECVDALRASDLIVHAGDLVAPAVLDFLRSLGPPVRAVHGNVDFPELRGTLPEVDRFEAEGSTIALLHDAGPARGRVAGFALGSPDAAAVVFGHSHLPLHEQAGDFQIFNPGSPTERRRAPRRSFGLADATRGRLEFRHVWLP